MKPDTEIGPDGWPVKQNIPLNFEDISEPLKRAIRFCYGMQRRNADKDVPWDGPDIGRSDKACCPSAKEQLSQGQMQYSHEDQGRDALEEILGLAIRLGIEQGRRILRSSSEYSMLCMKAAMADYEKGTLSIEKFSAALKGDYDPFAD